MAIKDAANCNRIIRSFDTEIYIRTSMKILIVLLAGLAVANALSYGGYGGYGKNYHGYGLGHHYGGHKTYHGYHPYGLGHHYGGYKKYHGYHPYGLGHHYGGHKTYHGYHPYGLGHHYGGYHYSSSCLTPPSSCFIYNPIFKHEWCTTKFYTDVLSYYPDDAKTIKSKADAVKEVQDKLDGKQNTVIFPAIDADHTTWKADLLKIVATFKAEHKTCITHRYASLIQCANDRSDTTEATRLEGERNGIITTYDTNLDNQVITSDTTCAAAVTAAKARITAFISGIVSKFGICYDSREAKITAFNSELDAAVVKYKADYLKALESQRDCNKEAFKAILNKICADATTTDDLVEHFSTTKFDITGLTTTYNTNVDAKVVELKAAYCKALKCYQYSGCLSFRSNTYNCFSRSLGCWWQYKLVDFKTPCFRIHQYKYTYHKVQYNCLTTCDVDKVNVDKTKLDTDWTDLNDKAVTAAKTELSTFIAKWVGIHADYVTKLKAIITSKNAAEVAKKTQYYKCLRADGVLTADDNAAIAALTTSLATSLTAQSDAYEAQLKAKRDLANSTGTASINSWEAALKATVTQLLSKYQSCLDARTTAITAFTTKIGTMKTDRRTCLETNLKTVTDKNVEQAKKIINAWFCSNADFAETAKEGTWIKDYRDKLEKADKAVLEDEFDAHWIDLEPKLIVDFKCRYKCHAATYSVCPWHKPCFFSWRVCYPSAGYSSHHGCYGGYHPKSYGGHYYSHPKTYGGYHYHPKSYGGYHYHPKTYGGYHYHPKTYGGYHYH